MTDDSETIEPVCGGARSLSAASHGNTQQKRSQQRTKRRFTRYVAQDAQRHARFSTLIDRVADSTGRAFQGFGGFRNRGLRLRSGV
jgi:hypothetical protein